MIRDLCCGENCSLTIVECRKDDKRMMSSFEQENPNKKMLASKSLMSIYMSLGNKSKERIC